MATYLGWCRYFDETYFATVYRKHYGDMGYWRVYQQMMKMHVFDMPWLLPNVLILDSDTVWSRDHTLVFPNGSVSYYNDFYFKGVGGSPEWESNRRKCLGADPVKVVNSLFKDIGCNFSKYCGTLESSGARHIMHHMIFQVGLVLVPATPLTPLTMFRVLIAEGCDGRHARFDNAGTRRWITVGGRGAVLEAYA